MTSKTRHQVQDKTERITRKWQTDEQDMQNRTGVNRTGRNRTGRNGQAEQERQDRKGRKGEVEPDRQNRTGRTGMPGQWESQGRTSQERTAKRG